MDELWYCFLNNSLILSGGRGAWVAEIHNRNYDLHAYENLAWKKQQKAPNAKTVVYDYFEGLRNTTYYMEVDR